MFVGGEFMVNNLAIKLVLPEVGHAQSLFNLVLHDQKELARFLPWAANMKTVQDEVDFIKMMRQEIADYQTLALVVLVDGQVAGMVDVHNISLKNECGEIGYWLGQAYQGRGIMTGAVRKVVKLAFDELGLHRLNLLADQRNHPSRAIAKRLNFTHVALLRDEVKYHGKFCDMDLYTMINE